MSVRLTRRGERVLNALALASLGALCLLGAILFATWFQPTHL